jgi:hypothetical protein
MLVTRPGNGSVNDVGIMELERNSMLRTGAFGFAERRYASPVELVEDLVVGDNFADHGKPTRACTIPTARRPNGTAAIYERVVRESMKCRGKSFGSPRRKVV